MSELKIIWKTYSKHMNKYLRAIKDKRALTASIHKEMAERTLDEYFSEIEKMLVEENGTG